MVFANKKLRGEMSESRKWRILKKNPDIFPIGNRIRMLF